MIAEAPRVQEFTATSWTLIRSAADGQGSARDAFACRYGPVVRAFLLTLWARSPAREEIDDAIAEVLLECMKDGGVLEKAEPRRSGGFRAFLFGVVRNVAARFEKRHALRSKRESDAVGDAESSIELVRDASFAFDRAWAVAVMKTATDEHRAKAAKDGPRAVRRVEILDALFRQGRTIRDVAAQWREDPAYVHHEYADARREFAAVLRSVVAAELGLESGSPDVETECRGLLALLGD
jgi:hypothetical protein